MVDNIYRTTLAPASLALLLGHGSNSKEACVNGVWTFFIFIFQNMNNYNIIWIPVPKEKYNMIDNFTLVSKD